MSLDISKIADEVIQMTRKGMSYADALGEAKRHYSLTLEELDKVKETHDKKLNIRWEASLKI